MKKLSLILITSLMMFSIEGLTKMPAYDCTEAEAKKGYQAVVELGEAYQQDKSVEEMPYYQKIGKLREDLVELQKKDQFICWIQTIENAVSGYYPSNDEIKSYIHVTSFYMLVVIHDVFEAETKKTEYTEKEAEDYVDEVKADKEKFESLILKHATKNYPNMVSSIKKIWEAMKKDPDM